MTQVYTLAFTKPCVFDGNNHLPFQYITKAFNAESSLIKYLPNTMAFNKAINSLVFFFTFLFFIAIYSVSNAIRDFVKITAKPFEL